MSQGKQPTLVGNQSILIPLISFDQSIRIALIWINLIQSKYSSRLEVWRWYPRWYLCLGFGSFATAMYRMHPCWHRHGCCGVVWVDDGWLTCTQPAPFHTFVKESLSLWDDVHSLNRPFIYKFTQSLSFDTLIHWYCIYTSYSQYDNMGICSIYTLPIRCFVGNFPRNTLPPWKTDLSTGGTAKERDHLLKNTFERWAGKPVDFSRRVPGCETLRRGVFQQHGIEKWWVEV